MQGDSAEKTAVVSHIKVVEARSDKFLRDLRETGRWRNGQRVWFHQVANVQLCQLFGVIACAFSFQCFRINRALLDFD